MTHQDTKKQKVISEFRNQRKYISALIIYAKIKLDKDDIFLSSLISCKAHDIMSMSYKNREITIGVDRLYDTPGALRFFVKEIFDCDNSEIIGKISRITKYRNKIIHEILGKHELKENTIELINVLYDIPKVQEYKEKYYENINSYETERELERYIGIIDEKDLYVSGNAKIEMKYFENLVIARKEIFPKLAKELAERLRSSRYNKFFKTEELQISRADSTSGYIWLSIPLDIKLKIQHKGSRMRKKIVLPTLSILMTPGCLYTYIDFGGESYYPRVLYFKYILSLNNLSSLIDRAKKLSNNNLRYFCFVDVYSYFYESEIIKIYKHEDIKINKATIVKKLRKRENDFKNCCNNKKPITWNTSHLRLKYELNYASVMTIKQLVNETLSDGLMLFEPLIYFLKDNIERNDYKLIKPDVIIDEYEELLQLDS